VNALIKGINNNANATINSLIRFFFALAASLDMALLLIGWKWLSVGATQL
jgi:hypothetical protein